MSRNKFFAGIFLVQLLLATTTAVADSPLSRDLKASEWSRPRSASAVIAMAPVADAVRAWHDAVAAGDDNARLQLLHASGEEGGLWAAELRDWLIALGVAPSAIELAPAGLPADRLELRVLQTVNRQ